MRAGVRRPWVGRVLHQGSVELRAGGIVLSVLRERHVMMGREPPIVAVARGEAIQQVQQCALLPGATVLCKWSDALPWAEAQLTYAAPRRKPTHSASAEMQHPRTPGPGIAGARKSLGGDDMHLSEAGPDMQRRYELALHLDHGADAAFGCHRIVERAASRNEGLGEMVP
jgi:hypothetical protein